MHLRDTYFEHTVRVQIDHAIAGLVTDEQVANGGRDQLEDELGEAAKWFDHSCTETPEVTFELRIGTAHETDVDDTDVREEATEYAREMFAKVGSAFDVDDLRFVDVTAPDTKASKEEEPEPEVEAVDAPDTVTVSDTDTANGNDTSTEPEPGQENTLLDAMGGPA